MKNTFGSALALTIFGESHGRAIGGVLDGMAAGVPVDEEFIAACMDKRRARGDGLSTPRVEADNVQLLSGVVNGHTTGTAIALMIENQNTRSGDYAKTADLLRPGHADYTAYAKYHGFQDARGGGHFSGRLTTPLCIAGGIALQALEARGIKVMAHVAQIGGISDLPMDDIVYREADRKAILTNDLPCIDAAAAGRMREEILAVRDELDSIGGIVECGIYGLPAGIGDPMFDGIENRIAQIAFGIPAVKGVEFGMGFAVAAMRGSENNDPYRIDAETGEIEVESNNAGGILGGISTGAPVMWRMAVKPTPSIGREQQTVDMDAMENAELSVHGRHDPCIVPRAVPVAEAAAALAIWDALLEDAAQR